MDILRYTASARLGAWDSIVTDREAFLSSLSHMLRHNARGSLEAIGLVETDDAHLASVTSICDKIAARGNPTFVDLDFENALLTLPELDALGAQAISEGDAVGMKLGGTRQFDLQELVNAAWDLLSLPFGSSTPGFSAHPVLPSLLSAQVGPEEDYFLGQFVNVFPSMEGRIQQQVRLGDLVNCSDRGLSDNYVDFMVESGPIRWVLELDGIQHEAPEQRAHDKKRDDVLKAGGWVVHRFPTRWIKDGTLSKRLARLRSSRSLEETRALECQDSYRSVEDCVAISEVHRIAFFSILWPLAVHRCMRGLIQLYGNEALNSSEQQRILVLEEDFPATADAFSMLWRIWSNIHRIAPASPAPPNVHLDILVGKASSTINGWRHPISIASEGVDVRLVSDAQVADEEYDIVVSHSFLLQEGYTGVVEAQYETRFPTRIRLRQAVGHRDDRALQWSDLLEYQLADVEHAAETTDDAALSDPLLAKSDSLLFFLQLIFRKRAFKDGQIHVIARVLQRKPAIALLPTGGGKSLIYQLSGLLMPGMVIVVDPLVSLMADQVENLKAVGIDLLGQISGRQEREVKATVMNQMKEGKLAFIFISPERLQDKAFRDELATVANQFLVSIAVIDEAHCISEWGHDFRPAYLHLPRTLERYCATSGATPIILALTGTASFSVLTDIQIQMDVSDQEAVVLPKSFDRHELRFEVIPTPANQKSSALHAFKQQLPRRLRLNPGSFYSRKGDDTNGGIVFVPHVNGSHGVTEVAKLLGNGSYFAGDKPKGFSGDYTAWQTHKDNVQHDFKRNRIQELVATNSFGMGIDKPNIRYTCHYMAPQSIESFYQEAGRAGRNGIAGYALCTILYSDDNWNTALNVLNEPDHKRAMDILNAVHWDNRGDLLFQSWFLLRTYADRTTDKEDSLVLWQQLSQSVMGMASGVVNTVHIPFNKDKEGQERAIYRLALLGVVADYTIDWNRSLFAIEVKSLTPQAVLDNLGGYLQQYKFESYVRHRVERVPTDNVNVAIEGSLNALVDFVYEEIVAKRKQALRTMGELCRTFESDSDFRNQILAYLQESEFSASLREWVGRSIDDIGIDQAVSIMHMVEDLEQRARLIGTTRRMLDEAPDNLALRFLSVLARAASESADSILGEVAALAEQVASSRALLREPDEILMRMAHELCDLRPELVEEVVDLVLRRVGTSSMARSVLRAFSQYPKLYADAVLLLSAEALTNATAVKFNDLGDKRTVQSYGKS